MSYFLFEPMFHSSTCSIPSSSHYEITTTFGHKFDNTTTLVPLPTTSTSVPSRLIPQTLSMPLHHPVAGTANATSVGDDERCGVCGEGAHGVHFGVHVCRACAAFFRRSTNARRIYRCRYDGNCTIDQKDVRCACRACRLAKCLALGMDPNAVQRNRDQIGPRRSVTKLAKRRTTERRQHSPLRSTTNTARPFGQPTATTHSLLPPLVTSSRDIGQQQQQKVVAEWEDQQSIEVGKHSSRSWTGGLSLSMSSHELRAEDGKLYTLLGSENSYPARAKSDATVNQLFLLRHALPSAFTAFQHTPPQATNGGEGDALSGGDSGNASSSAFASPKQHSPSSFGVVGSFSDNEIPLISKMLRGYRRFKSLRLSALHLIGTLSQNQLQQTLAGCDEEQKPLMLANYLDNVNIIKTDLSLIAEMLEHSFVPLHDAFSVPSKWALLRNFMCPFFISERSLLTARRFPPSDTRFVLSPYHYVDIAQLDHFFAVESCKRSPKEIAQVFAPLLRKFLSLFADFRELRVTDEEFVGLMGILFWNNKVDTLSAEERALALSTRERLFAELYTVCSRHQRGEAVPATQPLTTADAVLNAPNGGERFCSIINKFHLSHRLSLELASTFSLVNVSRAFEVDPFLHQLNPQTF